MSSRVGNRKSVKVHGRPTASDGGSGHTLGEVLSAAAGIASASDLQTVAAKLAGEACRLMGAYGAVIEINQPDGTAVCARHGETELQCDGPARERTPLRLRYRGSDLGSLELYWDGIDSMPIGTCKELFAFCELASTQLGAAGDREAQRLRLVALGDLATALRMQTHEHSSQMQVLLGLHELGDVRAAHEFLVEMMHAHEQSPAVRLERIADPVIAGTLVALTRAAHSRRVEFELDPTSQLEALPAALGALDIVTIVANCVSNGLDSVADEVTTARRRVRLAIVEELGCLRITVRDWGRGLEGREATALLQPGVTTKAGHQGMGLTLVNTTVEELGGEMHLRDLADGLQVTIILPCQ